MWKQIVRIDFYAYAHIRVASCGNLNPKLGQDARTAYKGVTSNNCNKVSYDFTQGLNYACAYWNFMSLFYMYNCYLGV